MDKQEINQICAQIGSNIRALRKSQGFTSEGLAEAVNITPQYISELEHGKKNMSVAILVSISRALGVSTDYLIRGGVSSDLDYDEAVSILAGRLSAMTPVERELSILMLSCSLHLVEGMGLEKG